MSRDDDAGAPARWQERTVPVRAEPEDARTVGSPARVGSQPASVFDRVAERFEEREELGRGGMGRVVEAVDRVLDRAVAIKHSLATHSADLARFEREARITARLQHPGIVPILDTGRDPDGRPFYVMRKIDGEPLGTRVTRAASVRDRLALVPALLPAVDAAAYAHARGVVHRDIKPWNILLGPFGETLLIDWGLARELDSTDVDVPATPPADRAGGLTVAGSAYGTPGFMAPEQARGEPADRRSDVYSLGATLYFVLAGSSPFEGIAPDLAIAQVAAGASPDFAAIPPEVPADLATIASKALAATAADRYADAGELAADLRRFLAGQLVAAHEYSTGERIVRWIRRHRIAATVAVVAVVAIAIVLGVSVDRVIDERDQARRAQQVAEDRAEDMLVDRARSLVREDPTSAVALLRGLPATSPRWAIARELVRAAVAGGVERAIVAHRGGVLAIAVADGGAVATAGIDGTIQVHDLAAGTSRVVSEAGARRLAWFDDRTLAFATFPVKGSSQVALVDIHTRTHRTLATGAFTDAAVGPGRVVVLRESGEATVFGPGPEVIATIAGIAAIDARTSRIALLAPDRLYVIEHDGTRRERAVTTPTKVFQVRISPAGDRVAALVFGAILEWQLDGDAAPGSWPRTRDALNDLGYAGAALVAWSTDGSGVMVLARDAAPRWSPAGEPIAIAPFAGGAVLATRKGKLAYLDEFGLVELRHRAAELNVIASDRAGDRVFAGTTTGELLVLDLAPVRPRRIAIAGATKLFDIDGERILAGTLQSSSTPSAVTAVELVDIATRQRTPIGTLGFDPRAWLAGDAIAGAEGGQRHRVVVWGLDGRERLRVDDARTALVGHGLTAERRLYYTTGDDVFEYPFGAGAAPRSLGRFTPTTRGRMPTFEALRPIADGVIATIIDDPSRSSMRHVAITRTGIDVLDTGHSKYVSIAGRTSDGAWWMIAEATTIVRVPPGGVAVTIPTDQPPRHLVVRGDRVWALGDRQVHTLALDGTIARSAAVNGKSVGLIRDALLERMPAAIELLVPDANVRRVLPLPTASESHVATPDGRVVGALVHPATPAAQIVIWRDPVPLDPADVPAYVERLTNGRLDLGSDLVRWK